MIENDEQLAAAVLRAGNLLQAINDYVADHPGSERLAKVRFPRGFLRTNAAARATFGFVGNATLRRNISYAIMAHDVLRWVLMRTDLSGQAKEMVIKEGVCLIASICESLTIHPTRHGLGRRTSFERRVGRLHATNVIAQQAHDDLVWLWGKRRHEHLYEVEIPEYAHYTMNDWLRSIRAFRALKAGLTNWLNPAAEP